MRSALTISWHGFAGDPRHHGRDRARVDTTTHEGPHRDIAQQVRLDGLSQETVEPFFHITLVAGHLVGETRAPVTLDRQLAAFPYRGARGRQLADTPE